MGSTDFLKKLTKEDKIIYSYAALTNLLEASCICVGKIVASY